MTEQDHPKVRLDNIAEYKVLLNRLETVARDKLAQNFPPTENATPKDEAYRKRVEELVMEYVQRTFDIANQNISINGNDIGNVESVLKAEEQDQYEPYDDSLRVRVNDLIQKVGAATTEVAKLRREVPKKAAKAFEKRIALDIDREIAAAEAAMKSDGEGAVDEDGDAEMIDWGIKPLARRDEIEKSWEEAVGLLPLFKKTNGPLATAQGQIVKAQQVMEYISESK